MSLAQSLLTISGGGQTKSHRTRTKAKLTKLTRKSLVRAGHFIHLRLNYVEHIKNLSEFVKRNVCLFGSIFKVLGVV
jgi:hypothetical protein